MVLLPVKMAVCKGPTMTKEEVEKVVDEKLKKQEVCPNCGRCPVCGESKRYWPYIPYVPYSPGYPWAGDPIPAGLYYTSTRIDTNTS